MASNRVSLPTFDPGIPRLGPCPPSWSTVRLGDVVEVVERPIKMIDENEYTLIVARRARGGIVSRGKRLGRLIRTKSQFEIKVGDFLISRRQIVHGACGVVPPELDGATVSNEYTVLQPSNQLLVGFLNLLAYTPYLQRTFYHSSVGVHVEKMVFRDREWLRYSICLPPVAEQEAILSIVDLWRRAVQWADRLAALSCRRKRALIARLFAGQPLFRNDAVGGWDQVPLGSLATVIMGTSPPSSAYNRVGEGIPLIQGMADVQNGRSAPTRWPS